MRKNTGLLICLTTLWSVSCTQTESVSPFSDETQSSQTSKVLTPETRSLLAIELKKQRVIWNKYKPENYSYRWQESCFCESGPYYGPNQIQVKNGSVSIVTYLGPNTDEFRMGEVVETDILKSHQIEALFSVVDDVISEKVSGYTAHMPEGAKAFLLENGRKPEDFVIEEEFTVRYNETYGFPELISYDALDVYDDQYKIVIENFEPQ